MAGSVRIQSDAMKTLSSPFPSLRRRRLETLQVNLGYRCNQSCSHCHVDAGPWRTEMMEPDQVKLIAQVLKHCHLKTLDLTGGAPELHPQFREIVREARAQGVAVIDRCNLTILMEPGQETLAEFLADSGVRIVASLPCYEQDRVDRQRGRGVFERSLDALKQLNQLGYGMPGSPLELDLVYNPSGPSLPPPQQSLQAQYREQLMKSHGISFHQLLTIANMPIKRFARDLEVSGELEGYQTLLREAHRPANLDEVMCRTLISVSWTGALHDCDFNQQLGCAAGAEPAVLADLLTVQGGLEDQPIAVADHCYGCTAGQGSSCGGSLS